MIETGAFEVEPIRLRREWMQIIGDAMDEIEESIRETPPRDVQVERDRLDGAKRMMEQPDLSASDLT